MRPRLVHALAPVACLCGLALAAAGCEQRNTIGDTRYTLDDVPDAGPAAGGWASAPFPSPAQCDGDDGGQGETAWLRLDGRETVEMEHGLGRVPTVMLVYVAFEEHGCGGTLAAGDIARFVGADESRVVIQNATTESFFMRLYLE